MAFQRLLILLLLSSVVMSFASPQEVEDFLAASIGKEVSCSQGIEGIIDCTINLNDKAVIECQGERCVVKSLGMIRRIEGDVSTIKKAMSFPSLLCISLENQGVEGCSCKSAGEGRVACNLDKAKVEVSCNEESVCSTTAPLTGEEISFSLRRSVSISPNETVIRRDIKGGYLELRKVDGERHLTIELKNAKGIKLRFEGKIRKNFTRTELRAEISGKLREIRESIKKARGKDVEVIHAVDVDLGELPLDEPKMVFELPCDTTTLCDNELEVWHIKDDGSSEKVDFEKRQEGDVLIIEFSPTSFSIYALATVGQISPADGGQTEAPKLPGEGSPICLGGLLIPVVGYGIANRRGK